VLLLPFEEKTTRRGSRPGGMGQLVTEQIGPGRGPRSGEFTREKYVGTVGEPLGAQGFAHPVGVGPAVHPHPRDRCGRQTQSLGDAARDQRAGITGERRRATNRRRRVRGTSDRGRPRMLLERMIGSRHE
jgi:hypothetical protein